MKRRRPFCGSLLMWTGVLAAALAMPATGGAQAPRPIPTPADTSARLVVTLRDGSTLIGRVVTSWGDSARFESLTGVTMLRSTDIRRLRVVPASAIRNGEYWPVDPSSSRLYFAPTGRMLPKGDGYYSNHWVFLNEVHHGVSDRFTLGGAMTLFPSDNFLKNNLYFISPKVGVYQSEKTNVAAGVFAGIAPFFKDDFGEDSENTFGIVYSVATFGSDDGSLSVGTGYGYAGGRMADNPLLMVGFNKRITRRLAVVSENWLFPNTDRPLVSYGVRTIGERLAWDFGFITVLGEDGLVPGVPWIGLTYRY